MSTFLIIVAVALVALLLLAVVVRARRVPRLPHLCNYAGVGTHDGEGKTYLTDAAVATRYLLAKIGTDEEHAAACGASDIPIGVFSDEAEAAEEQINVELLGISKRTVPMVASEAITAGEEVFTAAAGKVQDLPVAAATYYSVGYALTAASGDGVAFEVLHHSPRKLIVT